MTDSHLSSEEVLRYSRHLTLPDFGIEGQIKLKQASVLAVGAGGLGSPLLSYLAAAGVGRIGIVDFDVVEESNLQRQIIHGVDWIGTSKVDSAHHRLKEINPYCIIDTYNIRVDSNNILDIIDSYDIVCDGTDNFTTRYIINDYCKKNKKILISAAISKFDGQLFKFDFKKKIPCFRCFMPEYSNEENNCDTEGVFSPVAGILGSLQANEVLKTILGLQNDLNGNILVFDSFKMNLRKIKISKNSKCLNKCGQ
mgnify:CR=1 FL=1